MSFHTLTNKGGWNEKKKKKLKRKR